MPAEWEPHEATWIAWPHNREDWPGRFAPIPWVYGEIVRKLARVERVRILVRRSRAAGAGAAHSPHASAPISPPSILPVPTDRVWTRDYGPIFVRERAGRNGRHAMALQRLGQVRQLTSSTRACPTFWRDALKLAVVHARHGAGRRQHRRQRRGHAADHRRVPAEPGSGAQSGTDRDDIERVLRDYLGADRVIWLEARNRRATTRTATSTTWRASSAPNTVVLRGRPIAATPTTNLCARTWPS